MIKYYCENSLCIILYVIYRVISFHRVPRDDDDDDDDAISTIFFTIFDFHNFIKYVFKQTVYKRLAINGDCFCFSNRFSTGPKFFFFWYFFVHVFVSDTDDVYETV